MEHLSNTAEITRKESPQESLLSHSLNAYFDKLVCFNSTRKMKRSLVYQSFEEQIKNLVNGIEYGFYADPVPYDKKPFYRAVAWNVERGLSFDGILHTLKNHPEISKTDILYLTETDIGMARTKNRNVAREIALELGMNYFFAPGYLNLSKGNSVEGHYEGVNEIGVHGNAFLSRYPIENFRTVHLRNCKDKMKGSEKRIGCQKALVADVLFPYKKVTAITAHLDAHSSQRQRANQLRTILDSINSILNPVLLGGDLNTNCYNTRHAMFAFFGFWNKVFRGVDYIIDEHYPYPDHYFDKRAFKVFKDHGFDYKNFNEEGVGTLHYTVEDVRGNNLVQEVVPVWCRKVMEETLKRHGGKVSLKLDWFAGRSLNVASLHHKDASPPKVIPLSGYQGKPLSDHAPVLVDVDVY